MRGAIEIARYFTAHMLALYGAEDLSPEADAVLKVLSKCELKEFSQAYVHRKVRGVRRLERADDVAQALNELTLARFIRPVESAVPVTGRPGGPRIRCANPRNRYLNETGGWLWLSAFCVVGTFFQFRAVSSMPTWKKLHPKK